MAVSEKLTNNQPVFTPIIKILVLGNNTIHNVGVQYIFNSVLQALKKDPKRRYMFVIVCRYSIENLLDNSRANL